MVRSVAAVLIAAFVSVGLVAAELPRRDGVVLYKLKPSASRAEKKAMASVLALRKATSFKTLRALKVQGKRFKLNGQTEEDVSAELKKTGAVEFAEPDYLIAPDLLPNDPGLPSQWFHTNINSAAAWDVTTGNSSIVVAVCDTGVQSAHPDLSANLKLPGFNSVDNTSDTEPIHSHGTKVAGCIAAVGNNGVGVVGVTWNVKVLPVKISNLSTGSAYYSDMAEGIRWAADQGAKVANLSYGGFESSTIDSAAKYLRGKGGLLFMSAGNDGADVSARADWTSFVLVGATNSANSRSSFSNYGTPVDIAAPGESIYTTTTGSTYGYTSGTSFSSPISAGVGALIYSINPAFSPSDVESIIFSTCTDIGAVGEDSVYGHGLVNAGAAVNKARSYTGNVGPTAVASGSPTSGVAPLAVALDGSASSDPDGSIVSYSWNFGDGSSGSGAIVSHTYTSAGTFSATLTVADNAGSTATSTVTISVSPDPNSVAAPSGLSGSASNRVVTLSWTDNSNNETEFVVQRATKVKGGTSAFAEVGRVGANVTTFTQTVTANTYYYRLQAVSSTLNKSSGYSNQISLRVR